MPIQPTGARGEYLGEIEIKPQFIPSLDDLEGFSRIIVMYDFHRTRKCSLRVIPFLDTHLRGLFATRPAAPIPSGSHDSPYRNGDSLLRVIDDRYPGRHPGSRFQTIYPGFRFIPRGEDRMDDKRSDGAARVRFMSLLTSPDRADRFIGRPPAAPYITD